MVVESLPGGSIGAASYAGGSIGFTWDRTPPSTGVCAWGGGGMVRAPYSLHTSPPAPPPPPQGCKTRQLVQSLLPRALPPLWGGGGEADRVRAQGEPPPPPPSRFVPVGGGGRRRPSPQIPVLSQPLVTDSVYVPPDPPPDPQNPERFRGGCLASTSGAATAVGGGGTGTPPESTASP